MINKNNTKLFLFFAFVHLIIYMNLGTGITLEDLRNKDTQIAILEGLILTNIPTVISFIVNLIIEKAKNEKIISIFKKIRPVFNILSYLYIALYFYLIFALISVFSDPRPWQS